MLSPTECSSCCFGGRHQCQAALPPPTMVECAAEFESFYEQKVKARFFFIFSYSVSSSWQWLQSWMLCSVSCFTEFSVNYSVLVKLPYSLFVFVVPLGCPHKGPHSVVLSVPVNLYYLYPNHVGIILKCIFTVCKIFYCCKACSANDWVNCLISLYSPQLVFTYV